MTQKSYIKRIPSVTYKPQRRGGKGIIGMVTRDADAVERLFVTNTHDNILFFTNRGRVFQLKVYEVPDASRQGKGTPVVNLVQLEPNETVPTVLTLPKGQTEGFIVMATTDGTVKRTPLEQFKNVRRNGLRAITLEEGDELAWVEVASGDEDVMLVTRKGHSIRFPQEQVRSMGREAAGVKGIKLRQGRPRHPHGPGRQRESGISWSSRRRDMASAARSPSTRSSDVAARVCPR